MAINNSPKLQYHDIDVATFNIVAGAAAWIETDVSVTTGTDSNKIWVIVAKCAATGFVGARPHDSTLAPYSEVIQSTTLLSRVNNAGAIDLYRNLNGNIAYYFVGYFK